MRRSLADPTTADSATADLATGLAAAGTGTSAATLLSISMRHRIGALEIDLSFRLSQPWTVLFGPSGSGKSTVLRAIAGFIEPEVGEVLFGPHQEVLFHFGSPRVSIRPDLRPIRSAGQSAALFPHMHVDANLRFGLQAQAIRKDGEALLAKVARLFRIEALRQRRPASLSGGERQRVSVARAVAAAVAYDGKCRPLLLLDEPFTGIETALRDELAGELQAWLRAEGVPVLSVSHDIGEAFLLRAEVIRIAVGRLLAQGPAHVVLADERHAMLQRLG